MPTIEIWLPEPMKAWIAHRVESGLCEDASDYVRDLIYRDQTGIDFDMGSGLIQALIAEGIADLDAGRVFDADEVFDEIEARISAGEKRGNS